ncbi:TfuA-like protein [Sorangium sp. So ce1099]|uniref:TfuA-like protein n=1 Tax=Sorangium sp. So ce1099 TaxID=3133331 RepID=UPI003F63635A
MKVVIFLGPTLSAAEASGVLDATYLAPAARGDVYRAALERPAVIGIIDGYFERVPSVSHKEILWAMKEGIHVLGAASMGALRAAELAKFGMEGIGEVYEAFRRGDLDADDEVAVAHASAEDGYRPLSVAMVDIRATLAGAVRDGVIGVETQKALEGLAESSFYADRSYRALLETAKQAGLPDSELASFRAYWPERRVERKKLDAIAMLHTIDVRLRAGITPKQVRYHFQHTDAWEHITRKARGSET